MHLSLIGSGAQMSPPACRGHSPRSPGDVLRFDARRRRDETLRRRRYSSRSSGGLGTTPMDCPVEIVRGDRPGRHVTFVGAVTPRTWCASPMPGIQCLPVTPERWHSCGRDSRDRSDLDVGTRGARWLASLPSNRHTLDSFCRIFWRGSRDGSSEPLASAITAMIREDPTLFVAQASRRYLPSHAPQDRGALTMAG